MEDLLENQAAEDILEWAEKFYSQDIFYLDQKVIETTGKKN